MNKETVTEALKLEHRLEQDIQAIHAMFIEPLSAEPTTHSTARAKEACEAIKTATGDLRNVLYNMFFTADSNQ